MTGIMVHTMGMTIYNTIWGNSLNRTTILSSLIALFALFSDVYLLLWRKRLLEPLEFLNDKIMLFDWKYIDLSHVLLWSVVFFFGMIAYANARETFETPAGWYDFLGTILIIAFFLFIVYNEWVALFFLILSSLEVLYFYASSKEV